MPRLSSPVTADAPPRGPAASSPDTPWWVTALDVLCLVLIAFAVRAMVARGVRLTIGPFQLRLVSWVRLIGWAAALLAVRHWFRRTPPFHARVLGWMRAVVTAESVRAAWAPYVVSRVTVLAVAYFAVAILGSTSPRPWRALDSDVLDLFARWDAGWYFTIANVGYTAHDQFDATRPDAIAFFPAFPMLMRVVGVFLSVNRWVAGIVIVVVAFLWALAYLYRLAREDLPADQARAALLFLAFYPFAVCYSAILTESLFLLAAVASFFHLRRGQLVKTALFGLLAGLVRPNGFLLSVPLALSVLIPAAQDRGWLPFGVRREPARWWSVAACLAAASLPALGMLAYSAYVYSLTGDPFAWAKAQQAWGRSTALIVTLITERSSLIATHGWSAYPRMYPLEVMEGSAALFGLAAVWPITRRFGLPYGLFVAMAILPPLITMGAISLGRYTAPLFPIFLWLGAAVPERRRAYLAAFFAAGQALVAVMFFTWRAPY